MTGHIGKILGAIFGVMLAKLPGAVLGLLIGWYFDRAIKKDFSGKASFSHFFADKNELTSSAIFFHSLFSCLGHIAKADGTVTQSEIKVATRLMDDMNLTGNLRKEAQNAFTEGKSKAFPLKDQLNDLTRDLHGRRDVLKVFLEILIEATFADGELSLSEMNVLTQVCNELDFSASELNTLIKQYEAEMRFRQRKEAFAKAREEAIRQAQEQAEAFRRQSHERHHGQRRQYSSPPPQYGEKQRLTDAYQILNVDANADEKTLKKAYRKAMNEHHPDKLMAKGLPQAAVAKAQAKAQDIQAAYELIKKSRR